MLARVAGGFHHPLHAARPESAGDYDARRRVQKAVGPLFLDALRIHPLDFYVQTVSPAGVLQRLFHGYVRIPQIHVFADYGYGQRPLGRANRLHHLAPVRHAARAAVQAERVRRQVAKPLFLQNQRDFVDAGHCGQVEHRAFGDVAVDGDFVFDFVAYLMVGAADYGVGQYADAAQLADAVLCGLRLQLAGGGYVGQEGHVYIEGVVAPDFVPHLANRLKEGQPLYVAHRAADFHDYDFGGGLFGEAQDALFDGVRDMRDGLNRAAQKLPAPLAGYDLAVNPPRRYVGKAGQVHVHEPLVMPQIQVGLRTVVGDENLPVLIRRHGAGVDVEIGVELHQRHRYAAAFEDAPDGGDANPLADRADHPARNENYFGHGFTERAWNGERTNAARACRGFGKSGAARRERKAVRRICGRGTRTRDGRKAGRLSIVY